MATTGSRTIPVVVSVGVIRGPWKARVVGMVGENFIYVRRVYVAMATHVAEEGECWYTSFDPLCIRHCQKW